VLDPGRLSAWILDLRTWELSGTVLFSDKFRHGSPAPFDPQELEAAIHPDDRTRWRTAFDRAVAAGEQLDTEYRIYRPNGTIVWLHVWGQVVRDPDGTPLRMNGVSLDVTERRSSDLRLEVSEESLRLATEAAEVGTWDLDLTTDLLTWSDRTKAMFGISRDAHVSMADFYAGLHPDDFDTTAAAFASAIDPAVRGTYDVEYRTIGKEDGVTRWVAAKGKGLFADGVCRRAIGTAIDITARKRAEIRQAFVLDLMDRLRRLTSPGAILDTAAQALGKHLGASCVGFGQARPDARTVLLETCYTDGAEARSGTFPLDPFGRHHIDEQRFGRTVAVDDVAADPRSDLGSWDTIEARAFVSVPLVREGQLRATLFVNHRDPRAWERDDVRLIEDVAARIWDALERARAEDALRQLNASLERQVEARTHERDRIWRVAPVLMLVGDSQGILLEANPAWTKVLGWSQDETIGHDVMEFVAPEDRAAGSAGMAQLFAGQAVVEYQLTFLTKSGDRRRIAWTTVPEGDRLYGHGRDVTDQVLAEERLRQAQKMEALGQLAGGIAHDFNNVLQAAQGGAGLIERNAGDPDTVRRVAGMIAQAIGRGAAITRRLLAFSRQDDLRAEVVDPVALLTGMQEILAHTLGDAIEVRVEARAGLPPLLADKAQLETVLVNLATNARDAMPEGGALTLSATHDAAEHGRAPGHLIELAPGRYVRLAVADTGAGMAPEVLARATEPFFTTKRDGEGTGLGLSMAKGFAEQSGGGFLIESATGRGTSISLWLPVATGQVASAAPAVAPAASVSGAPFRVLLVDDDAMVREVIAAELAAAGYGVALAPSGAEALALLDRSETVDAVISDLSMPGQDGLSLIREARRRRPGLAAILLTGFVTAEVALGDAPDAPFCLLRKPVTGQQLAENLAPLLERQRALLGC
jgi:PAS domain S-box-containing protein